jgi:hypothetical protein
MMERNANLRAGWILAVTVLVVGLLCVGFHWERWRKGLLPLKRAQTAAGEGLVIRSDGLGYYAWLRSLLIDGDWSFDNEFDEHNTLGDFVPPASWRTPIGRRALPWSIGPACWWALAIVPGHAILLVLQGEGLPWAADGYSLPYQILVACGTLLAAALTLLLLHGICRRYARPERAALAAALLTLGTTIVFYEAIEVSMAHGVGTLATAALTCYWLRSYGSPGPGRWFLVGLLLGLAALVRWQLVTFAILPLGEAALRMLHRRAGSRSLALSLVLMSGGLCIGFLPQMIAWRCVYGQWLAAPLATSPHWLTPALHELLWAQDRGLFYWTPLTLFACLGFASLVRRDKERQTEALREPAVLLLLAFVVQVYVLASLWGGQVYLGAAFGFRHLTEALVALAPGLALLLERSTPRRCQLLAVTGILLVTWNLLLIAQYRYGLVPAAGGRSVDRMAANVVRLIVRKKALLVGQVFAGPGLLLWLSRRSSRPRSRAAAGPAVHAG